MKTVYRIITPIIAVGGIFLGMFLKMFKFVIGSADQQIENLLGAMSSLISQNGGKNYLSYEFSIYDLIKLLTNMKPHSGENAKTFTDVAGAVIPHLISFFVIFALTILVLVAIAVVSAALSDSKKKRTTIIGLSAAGILLIFVCIIISNAAFGKITNGDISIKDLMTMFSDNALMAAATEILTVTSATLSAGFFAVFGIFIVLIIWTIYAGMVIKTPIQKSKAHRRKKTPKRLSTPKKKAK